MKQQINWKPFIPLIKSVFYDDKKTGGRPHTDELVVVRSMLLQAWYNLSNPLSVTMPKTKQYLNRPFLQFLQNLVQRFPHMAHLLQLPMFEKLLNR